LKVICALTPLAVLQDPKLEGEQRDVISSRKDVATAAEALAASIS
jgi:hypothetical protein